MQLLGKLWRKFSVYRQTDGRTDGRTDRQTDGRTWWKQYTPLNFVGGGIMKFYKILCMKNYKFWQKHELSQEIITKEYRSDKMWTCWHFLIFWKNSFGILNGKRQFCQNQKNCVCCIQICTGNIYNSEVKINKIQSPEIVYFEAKEN